MGKACLVLIMLAGIARPAIASDPADAYPDLHLIPWPKSLKADAGYLRVTAASRIVADNAQLKPLAEILASEIATLTKLNLEVTTGSARAGDFVLRINRAITANELILTIRNHEPVRTTDGAHTIVVAEQAVVEGFDYRAVAEGTATILQLLGRSEAEFRLPRVAIKDWPHADYCGVMLDVARQDHSIDDIRKVVQLCRLYKARYLQLHLTDDQGWTFPSTKFPRLGAKNFGAHGGIAPRRYKLDELKALVAYADARGVTLVPEFEMPGHSGAALRSLPEIFDAMDPDSKQPVGMGCINMSNEDLYPALDVLIGEMCDVFHSSPYFHVGSDEVTSGRLSLHPGYKAFMAKHGLKDDQQLSEYFIASVCSLVRKHGKKAIKWEGLANTATKDVIIMAWEGNSHVASEMIARGYTTITCPWGLGVPWEQWNMYVCNASRLKKGDLVLGATLVAWEQPPLTHITNLRRLAERQERTWGPDNSVTVEGFASRFQPLDAIAGMLIDLPAKPQLDATFSSSVRTSDFLDPVFAFDGNNDTFFKSAVPFKKGDHFTLTLPAARQVYALGVLTGINGRGLLDGGEVQVSADGETFATVARLERGVVRSLLKDNRVKAVRIRAATDQAEPLVLRAINLNLMVEVSGVVRNPSAIVGAGNVAVVNRPAQFEYPIGGCSFPIMVEESVLKLDNGGNPYSVNGPISGTGIVEIRAGGPNASLTIDGNLANTFSGSWMIESGHVVLAKSPGVDAMAGTIIVKGNGGLVWTANDQLNDTAKIYLRSVDTGGASIHLNGCSDTIALLDLQPRTRVMTDGPHGSGVLTVRELVVDGKRQKSGIYAAPMPWIGGRGYVIVGDVKLIDVNGIIADPNRAIGAGSMAVLKAATTFTLPEGGCSVAVRADHPLTLIANGNARCSGFITGNGALKIEANHDRPFEITGPANNSLTGPTTLEHGVLSLNKPANALALAGDLVLGGSATENKGDAVEWNADGQLAPTAVVTLQGTEPSHLDLNGHRTELNKLLFSKAASVRTGTGGSIRVKQLFVDGQRLKDGEYRAPQSWFEGTGVVTVDSRINVRGVIGSPETVIGVGNIGNLTGDTMIGYPSGGGDYDIITNGFTIAFDSGNGNAFAYSGSISGNGNVEFFMGPSYTGFRDAPMLLTGPKPNTTTGKFFVRKGRVQLEKPEGIVAISGDVTVGGQGFNDCLCWKNSHQLKDTVRITLLDAGNSGGAYLHLNGCRDTAASLTMSARNKILTDSADGTAGELRIKKLTIGGTQQPAGTYTSATARWIEGKGRVVVQP